LVDLKDQQNQFVLTKKNSTMNANRPIRDIMSTSIVTVAPDTSILHIKEILDKQKFHHIPVVENGGVLSGIITKTDILRFAFHLSLRSTGPTWMKKALQAATAKDIMTKNPLVLESEDTVGLAADIFLANKFHALPIVEDDILVGIITTHDLLMYEFGPLAPMSEQETEYL